MAADTNAAAAHDSGLYMGSPADDSEKVASLETELGFWKDKAATTSQRFADYENEIRVLKAQVRNQQRRDEATGDSSQQQQHNFSAPSEMSGIARFGSLIGARKPVAVSPQQNGGAVAREKELEDALVKEQTRRIAAEQKVRAVNAEIEELSVTLFQQANEMVAKERRENADLKEQLTVAEKSSSGGGMDSKTMQKEIEKLKDRVRMLEQRDLDRKRRLERLEAANKRIERVRTLLFPR